MALEFKFPDVGEGIHDGKITKWLVKIGDTVKEDQPLVEMETAKAVVEIPSPKAGVILALMGKVGDVKWVGATLLVIGEKGEVWSKAKSSEAQAGPGVIGQIPTEEKGVVLPPRKPEGATVRSATPARSRGEDYSKWGAVDRVPLLGVRKAVAEHMVKSKFTIPHVTHMDEADATELMKLREDKKAEAEKKGTKLTFLPFIIKAAIEALKKHPALNASLDQEEIVYKKYYNMGIAVDTPEGLMVPVLKNADKKDVFEIAKEIVELAEKCRDKKIHLDETQGGSFSITNVGSIGGTYVTPIISYGQTANLGVMKIKEKPVAIDGKVVIRPTLTLALSYDHRVVDGAEAARFMNDLIVILSPANAG